jgi:hypothetical protein
MLMFSIFPELSRRWTSIRRGRIGSPRLHTDVRLASAIRYVVRWPSAWTSRWSALADGHSTLWSATPLGGQGGGCRVVKMDVMG